ncbi:hypothetical protein AKJ40_04590 [candidate division MSBL1 archaeon SCGC-AAA259M10]|uniref:Methyltransferase domain-containing protein n=4 Tax=candidate division MSBL1 TaxID=215777 RepID=A0A133V5P4_9EURY|nr:hypothetical protein AKJ63_01980 [candidate division MSBL1 archaeon SCGC-AAA259D18]KXA95777.1 hypothetical protein AKJ65_00745 [candidate division MSBL1 archaeon SCGC-AAA259E19]KXA98640.1 hypothetical protein AKJ40_04590 [candidate division MSBL1 archaeon SCGC-AAA259M10]KXB01762.1 hypothetical protein AKJ41_00235 [candidate division MSBL1 archaeon SCGC-AAA259O05]
MEIGVDTGDNAVSMVKSAMKNFPPEKIEYYGFDTFSGKNNNQLERVKRRLSKTGCRFELYKGDSTETLPRNIGDLTKMDLIFIDGGHAYQVTKSDWENSKVLMHSNTAVFFHNYDFSGPKKVVDDIPRKKFNVEILDPPSDCRTGLVKTRNNQ